MKLICLNLFTAGFLAFIYTSICAQPKPVLEWHRTLGSSYGEYPGTIFPTSDGGYIISGHSAGADGDVMGHHGNSTVGDIWVVKLDRLGNIEWQKSYGGNDSDAGGYIIQTPDGGYLLAGSSASRDCNIIGNHGGFDYWALKLNSRGDVIWQKLYGGSQEDYVSSISMATDGGYFLAGYTLSTDGNVTGNHGQMDCWIVKIDASGNMAWQKTLGGSEFDNAKSIQATADGGCVIAANTYSSNGDVTGYHGGGDYWVVKLDRQGVLQWQKALGGSMTEIAASIQVTQDGGYIVSGQGNSFDGDVIGCHGGYDAWVVKLNSTGNITWQKCYGGSQNESANDIQKTVDGGYVFTGLSYSVDGDVTCNAGIFDLLVVKISNIGQPEWQTSMGGHGNDEGVSVRPLTDGSFIILGYTESPNVAGHHAPAANADGKSDYWVVKLSQPMSNAPAPIVKIDPASAMVCANNPVSFTASVLYAGVNPVYQWKKNGVNVGTNSPRYSDISFMSNDQVSCVVHPGNVCENNMLQGNDNITIQLKGNGPDPTITIAADNTSICNCSTITVKAMVTNGGGAPHYQWKLNGNNTGTDAPFFISNKIRDGDMITCSYSDNSVCEPGGVAQSNTIQFGGTGAALSVTITVDADTICKGTNTTFTANALNAGTNPIYEWRINNVYAGGNSSVFNSTTLSDGDVVSCKISTNPAQTCGSSGTAVSNNIKMQVINSGTPSVIIAADATTICAGAAANFTATATNAGVNPAYQWKINGVNTGDNDKIFSSSGLVNNDVISCRVTVDPQFTCALGNQAVSQNITMTVNTGEPPSVTITADKNNACRGEMITFSAQAQYAGSNPVFDWILNDNVLSNHAQVYSSNQLKNGDFLFCRIIPGAGACSAAADSSNIIVAAIIDTPVVHISPADTTIGPDNQVRLIASVTGNIRSFQWTPSTKLINPTSLTPQTTALNENFTYKLEVENDNGCHGSATSVVKVFTQLYMPSAFTPNDDGLNDQFRIPPSSVITLKEFSVFNRWGTRVFSTKNVEDGWDGTIRGRKQDAGVYVYYIRAMINDKEVFLRGNFLLVR